MAKGKKSNDNNYMYNAHFLNAHVKVYSLTGKSLFLLMYPHHVHINNMILDLLMISKY